MCLSDSLKKQEFYKTLGADKCFNYRNADFVSLVQRQARETGIVSNPVNFIFYYALGIPCFLFFNGKIIIMIFQ